MFTGGRVGSHVVDAERIRGGWTEGGPVLGYLFADDHRGGWFLGDSQSEHFRFYPVRHESGCAVQRSDARAALLHGGVHVHVGGDHVLLRRHLRRRRRGPGGAAREGERRGPDHGGGDGRLAHRHAVDQHRR